MDPLPLSPTALVVESAEDSHVGSVTGQCKWFNDKLGYGFVTVQTGESKGKDIFVHHSGIKPLNSNYKTLKKGEYINFDIVSGDHGPQAVHVTGIGGGTLMCDVIPAIKAQPPPIDAAGYTMVDYGGSVIGTYGDGYGGGGYGGAGRGGRGGRGGGRGGRGRGPYPPPPPMPQIQMPLQMPMQIYH